MISTGIPLIRIPKMAPIAASGREQRIAIGALIDLNVITIIKNTIPMETSIIRNKSVKSSACWLLEPPTKTSTFSGKSMPFLSLLSPKTSRFTAFEISDSFAGSTEAVTRR